ncbi:MAG: thioredoxin [Candidatus Latescibacteria bacterium]|nr:thioredoxin [Candidatus Latescibacterota bacterium]
MATLPEITDNTYQTELAGPEPVLVDFWAPWCGPCRMVAPLVEAVARKYQGRLKVAKVNVDDNPLLATKYNIMGIPTLAFFRDGQIVDQIVGAAPQGQVEKAVEEVLAS